MNFNVLKYNYLDKIIFFNLIFLNEFNFINCYQNGTISNSESFNVHVVFRYSNLTVNELFNIAKCSSASMCSCFKYSLIYEDSETTN